MPELGYATGGDAATAPTVPLDAAGEARARALLAGPVASLHEHPVRLPEPLTADTWAAHMRGAVDVLAGDELAASALDLVVATCFSQPDPAFVASWAASMSGQIAAQSGLRPVRTRTDLDGPGVGVALGLEDLGTVRTLGDLDELQRLGIVMAGVAYNHGSPLGCGLAQHDTGLTNFGHEAIARMNALGMVVDVSHAGDRTSLEAIEASTAPVAINHAGAQSLWGSTRMVPDRVIRAAAERGGVIGIEAAPGSTRTDANAAGHTVHDVVRHIEYCAESFGVDAVALGGDTFYGDHVGLYRALDSRGSEPPAGAVPFDLEPVAGADNPSELPVQVCRALITRGWADVDIAAVLGGNARRLLTAVLPERAA
ncbi:membrane dipeptidase [Microbacterium sp. NPDC079995]|uniref:dipeptidase n=1 Tax=unclassified Microbacterium TaxID=2609290 RepID=UPI00344B20E0